MKRFVLGVVACLLISSPVMAQWPNWPQKPQDIIPSKPGDLMPQWPQNSTNFEGYNRIIFDYAFLNSTSYTLQLEYLDSRGRQVVSRGSLGPGNWTGVKQFSGYGPNVRVRGMQGTNRFSGGFHVWKVNRNGLVYLHRNAKQLPRKRRN